MPPTLDPIPPHPGAALRERGLPGLGPPLLRAACGLARARPGRAGILPAISARAQPPAHESIAHGR